MRVEVWQPCVRFGGGAEYRDPTPGGRMVNDATVVGSGEVPSENQTNGPLSEGRSCYQKIGDRTERAGGLKGVMLS